MRVLQTCSISHGAQDPCRKSWLDIKQVCVCAVPAQLPRLFSEKGVRHLQRSMARITWSGTILIEIAQLRGFLRKPTLECAYLDACGCAGCDS